MQKANIRKDETIERITSILQINSLASVPLEKEKELANKLIRLIEELRKT